MADPSNPIFSNQDSFAGKWDALAGELQSKVDANISAGMKPRPAVAAAMQELKIAQKKTDWILDGVVAAAVKGGAPVTINPAGMRHWWLNKHWPGDALTLSERTTKLVPEWKSMIGGTISDAMKASGNVTSVASAISKTQLMRGDIAKHLEKTFASATKLQAFGTTPAELEELKKAIAASKGQVSRLAQAGAPFGQLKASYQRVIDAAEKLDPVALKKAIAFAIKSKARYNAERIARTEMARAYGVGFQERLSEDQDAVGYQSILSSRHPVRDICDFHAEADLYGMGRGVYPKHSGPPYPYHPHCTCVLRPVYRAKGKGAKTASNKAAIEYLQNQTKPRQVQLLGVSGRAKFLKQPQLWPSLLKNYAGQEAKGAIIPAAVKKAVIVPPKKPKAPGAPPPRG